MTSRLLVLPGTAPEAEAAKRSVRKVYPVSVNCTSFVGTTCTPPFKTRVRTEGMLVAEFTASSSHCTEIGLIFQVDATNRDYGDHYAQPGQSSGKVNLGSVKAGRHTVRVSAYDIAGGCDPAPAAGGWTGWSGELKLTVSRR
jgi:hypothetical protein